MATKQQNLKEKNNAKSVIIFLFILVGISLIFVGTLYTSSSKMTNIRVSAYEKVKDSKGKTQSVFTTLSVIGDEETLESVDEDVLQRATSNLLKDENLDDLYTNSGIDAFNQKVLDSLNIPEDKEVEIIVTDFSIGQLADVTYQKESMDNSSLSTRSKYMEGLFGNLKGEKK